MYFAIFLCLSIPVLIIGYLYTKIKEDNALMRQKEMCLLFLYKNRHRFVSAWEFTGEKQIFDETYVFPYNTPKVLLELYHEIPLNYKIFKLESGNTYPAYKWNDNALTINWINNLITNQNYAETRS